MAIAVSQAYKDVQSRRGGKQARIVVQYKRRYFDTGAVAFAYEPNYHVLNMNQFTDPGEIVDQLDVAQPGIFKSTTVTMRLKNTRNQWQRSVNDPSVFAADALAPNGYFDDQTIFQILKGFKLPDGTWEDCPQFTGYAADFTPIPKEGVTEVLISASLLADSCAAIKVNTRVTGEAMAPSVIDEPLNPSPGDGTTALLKTTSTGVISVINVKANGTALTPVVDYTVSIPTDGTAAKITLIVPSTWTGKAMTCTAITQNLLTTSSAVTLFSTLYANGVPLVQGVDYTVSLPSGVVGPAQANLIDPELWIGKAFTWDGSKGTLNQTVQAAVAMHCDAAGISSSMRNIQPVVFPGGLSSSKTIDTQADWQAGSLIQNIDTLSSPGQISRLWFLLEDGSSSSHWSDFFAPWAVVAGKFAVTNAVGVFDGPTFGQALTAGSVEAEIVCTLGATWWVPFAGLAGGYGVQITPTTLTLYRYDGTGAAIYETIAATLTTGAHASAPGDKIRVTRDSSGVFNLYVNGAGVGAQATDTTYTTFAEIIIDVDHSANTTMTFCNMYFTNTINSTVAVTNLGAVEEFQFNLLSTPASLGTLDHFEVLNTGGVTYKTACAPDSSGSPGTYDALQVLGAGNQMTSTPRQWLKIRVELAPGSLPFSSPSVQKLVAHFITAAVTLSQVAPTSGTAASEIQAYAEMCNYETGWDSTGIFYFRSRTVSGAPVIALDPWTNIIDMDDTHPGWDHVFNVGHATQTPYEYYYDGAAAGELEPTSERRFGAIQRDLDFSNQLVANDALIGKAAAQTAYQDNFQPRWRCRVQVKDIPWLQLSDPVSLTFVRDPKMLRHIAGDPLQRSGFAGPPGVALAINKKMKIVGITRKLKACTRDLLLEEILS